MILAERLSDDESPLDADSRNLITVITLKSLLSGDGKVKREESVFQIRDDGDGKSLRKQPSNRPAEMVGRRKCKIVTELLDPESEQVMLHNSAVRKQGSYVYTNTLEMGVFATAVSSKVRYEILMGLCNHQSGIGHITVALVRDYVHGTLESLSFYDLHARVSKTCGGVLLGWRQMKKYHPVVNPDDKTEKLDWSSGSDDELIILRQPGK
mmetsp:Transcript_2894/g.5228  ORF Transcript_2894/g.5228 Transcript_2894/m.5228 type:complete len:210 (+) Transcript_2894:2-631(+)